MQNWQNKYLEQYRHLLGISNSWRITLQTNEHLLSERETDASVDIRARLLDAIITVKDDTLNDPVGRERIAHELVHVAMAELSDVVRVAMGYLPDDTAGVLRHLYESAEERFVTRLARGLAQEDFDV